MDPTYHLRKAMLARLLRAAGVAALAGPAITMAACGGKVIVDGVGEDGVGGAGGASSGSGTMTTGTGATCVLTSTGASTGPGGPVKTQVTECISMGTSGCPNQYHAAMAIIPSMPCMDVVSVDCEPVVQNGKCCYLVTEEPAPGPCGTPGRPFLVGVEARTAEVERADRGWTQSGLALEVEGLIPSLPVESDRAPLSPDARAALAQAWEADGLLEHASIAAFSRFAIDLLAVGAPPDLIAAALAAATDEVRHARLCFALAHRYGGQAIAPLPFPFGGAVDIHGSLAALAAATAREGCIGETLSATVAGDQLARATDPAVRRALAMITEDESRHAELAWRTVAWAIERGGEEVRSAVEAVFAEADQYLPAPSALPEVPPEALASLTAYGRLDPAEVRVALIRALDEVIRPCAQALLERAVVSIAPAISRRT